MKRQIINVPIFNQKIILVKSKSLVDIENWIQDVYSVTTEPIAEYNDGAVWVPNGDIIVGFMEDSSNNSIIHETGHVVFAINRIIGLDYNEETFCYLLDWLYPKVKSFFDD